jgi:DNA polymerase beta
MGIHKKNKNNYTHSYIGAHTSITPNILAGIEYMHELGATAIQIFTGPSQSSSLRVKQNVPEPELIKRYVNRNGIKLVIHAIYTLNLCSAPATSKRIKYAQDNLIYDLELGEKIGACCVVVHVGSQGNLDTETAYTYMAGNISTVLHATAKTAPNVKLALEVPAGQGKQIASSLANLTRLWMLCLNELSDTTQRRRLGICLDTAHLFTSGQDIRTVEQLNKYLSAFDSAIGNENIFCIHLNDSKAVFGAKRDLHQGLGDGYLFGDGNMSGVTASHLKVIQHLVYFAKGLAIPIILETHSAGSPDKPGGELYAQELTLLKQLASTKGVPKGFKTWKLVHAEREKKRLSNTKTKKAKAIPSCLNYYYTPKGGKILDKRVTGECKRILDSTVQKAPVNTDVPVIVPGTVYNTGLIAKFKRLKDFYTNVSVPPDKFRALAYSRAIIALQSYPEEILRGAQVAHLPGVGAKIVEKINEYLASGNMHIFAAENIDSQFDAWERSQKDNIAGILGFGPVRVKQLAKQGIRTITQLRDTISQNKIKLTATEAIGLKYHDELMTPVPRDEAKGIVDGILSELKKAGILKKFGLRGEIAGSWPSGKVASKDIDMLLFTDKYPDADKAGAIPGEIMKEIVACLREAGGDIKLIEVISIGAGKLMAIVKRGGEVKCIARHIDIRLLPSGAEVFGRFYFTSGRVFNQMVRAHAKQQGYKLNEFGLYDLRKRGERVQGLDSEEKIMAYIGLNYVPMNKRR